MSFKIIWGGGGIGSLTMQVKRGNEMGEGSRATIDQ